MKTLIFALALILPSLSYSQTVDQEAQVIIEAAQGRSTKVLMVACFVGKSPSACHELRAKGACKYDVLRSYFMQGPDLNMTPEQRDAYEVIRIAGNNIVDVSTHQTLKRIDNFEHWQNQGRNVEDDGRLCNMQNWPSHLLMNTMSR